MTSIEGVSAALARTASREVVVTHWPEGSDALAVAIRTAGATSSDWSTEADPTGKARHLTTAYGEDHAARLRSFSPLELSALSNLLFYLQSTVGRIPEALPTPRRTPLGDTLEIDAATLRGLEVLTSATGKRGSLLAVIDRTVSATGARLLQRQLVAPLTRLPVLKRRLAMVRALVDAPQVRSVCRENGPARLHAAGAGRARGSSPGGSRPGTGLDERSEQSRAPHRGVAPNQLRGRCGVRILRGDSGAGAADVVAMEILR